MGCAASASIAEPVRPPHAADAAEKPRAPLAAAAGAAGDVRGRNRPRPPPREHGAAARGGGVVGNAALPPPADELVVPCCAVPSIYLLNGPRCTFGLGHGHRSRQWRQQSLVVGIGGAPLPGGHSAAAPLPDPPRFSALRRIAAFDVSHLRQPVSRSRAIVGGAAAAQSHAHALHVDAAVQQPERPLPEMASSPTRVLVYCAGDSWACHILSFPSQRRVTFAQVRRALGQPTRDAAPFAVPQDFVFLGMRPATPTAPANAEALLKVPTDVWPPGVVTVLNAALDRPLATGDCFVVVREAPAALQARANITARWFDAVAEGDPAMLERLARAHVGVAAAARDACGSTALHLAAREGDAILCGRLVRLGADLTARDGRLCTPLHCAAAAGSLSVVALLLERALVALGDAAAVGDLVRARNASGLTAAHHALLQAQRAQQRGAMRRSAVLRAITERIVTAVTRASDRAALLWTMAGPQQEFNLHLLAMRVTPTVLDAVTLRDHDTLECLLRELVVEGESRAQAGRHPCAGRELTQNLATLEGIAPDVAICPRTGALHTPVCQQPALHHAALLGDAVALRLLLTAFANAGMSMSSGGPLNDAGESAVFVAVRCGRGDALLPLFAEFHIPLFALRTPAQRNIMHAAFSSRAASTCVFTQLLSHPDFSTELLCDADSTGATPLHLAFSPALRIPEADLLSLLRRCTAGDLARPCAAAIRVPSIRFSAAPAKRRREGAAVPAKTLLTAAQPTPATALAQQLHCLAVQFNLQRVAAWLWDAHPPHTPTPPGDSCWHPFLRCCRCVEEPTAGTVRRWLARYPDGLLGNLPVVQVAAARDDGGTAGTPPFLVASASEVLVLSLAREDSGARLIGAGEVLVALSGSPHFAAIVRRFALSPAPAALHHAPGYRVDPGRRLLWRRLMLGPGGIATPFTVTYGSALLRHLLTPAVSVLSAEEKAQVAATALRYVLLCDPFVADATPTVVEICVGAIVAAAGGRAEGRTHLPPPLSHARIAPARMMLRGAALDAVMERVAASLVVALDDTLFAAAALSGFHGFAAQALRNAVELPPTAAPLREEARPSIEARVAVLCTMSPTLCAENVALTATWWDWDAVFQALARGLHVPGLQRRFPADDVLNAVVEVLQQQQLPALPPPAMMPRLVRACKVGRAVWGLRIVRAVVHFSFSPAERPELLRAVVRCAFLLGDVDLLRDIVHRFGAREPLRWAVRMDSLFMLSRVLAADPEGELEYVRSMPELLFLACRSRSASVLGLLAKDLRDLSPIFPPPTGTGRGGDSAPCAFDECAANTWRDGAMLLAAAVVRLAPDIASSPTAVIRAVFFSDGIPGLPAHYRSANRALYTAAFGPSLRNFAAMGLVPRTLQRITFVGDADILMRSVHLVHRQELLVEWAQMHAPAAVDAALLRFIERGNVSSAMAVSGAAALLTAGASPNARRSDSAVTVLHLAVRRRSLPLVKLLAARGADVAAIDGARHRPLDDALALRFAAAVEHLRPLTPPPPPPPPRRAPGEAKEPPRLDLEKWYAIVQARFARTAPSPRVSPQLPMALQLVLRGLLVHPVAGRGLGPAGGPYLQHPFPEDADRFALVPAAVADEVGAPPAARFGDVEDLPWVSV